MEKTIDLHIHTNCSDGALSPFEIIDEALKNKVSIISITDHDTIAAYTQELIDYAKEKGITLIKGIEISTKTKKCGIHVLGYNVDINNRLLIEKLNKIQSSRIDYLYNVAKKLENLGYNVNVKELEKIESVTKAHIARSVISDKKNKKILIDTFNSIPNMGMFIETIMNEGCPAYVEKKSITPKEAAQLIRQAGGKVVLAHPIAYTYEDNLSLEETKQIISDMDADGVEAYYIYVDKNGNKHDNIIKWNIFAKENDVFTTIGSDFHINDGIHPTIGLISENIDLSDVNISKIINNICE